MRRFSFANYIYILTILLAAIVGWVWGGRTSLAAQDQAQLRLDQAAPIPHGETTVSQTFMASHNGLSAVEVLAVVYPNTPLSLQMDLVDAQRRPVASATLANVKHNTPLRLSFRPQPNSAGQTYTLRISGPAENGMTVWAYSLDAYARGTLLVNGTPVAGDLRFSTTYTYLWKDALHDAAVGLGRLAVLAIPLWLILFAPGLLLLNVLARDTEWARPVGVRWGLALALSLSFLALAWLWATVVGGALSAGVLWVAYAAAGILVVWQGLKRWRSQTPVRLLQLAPSDMWLALISLATLVTRLLAARGLTFPVWVDSPHHYTIARLMAESGRVPDNYYPLLPIDQFTYHFGFHALAVSVHWLSPLSLMDTFLVVGQVLQGLMPLAIYAAAVLLTGRSRAGIWAAFFVGLVSFFPGYYLTWGRYTQLAGLVILAPTLGWVWRMVAPGTSPGKEVMPLRLVLRPVLIVGILMAGILLTHYRVMAFLAIFSLAALSMGARGGWKRIGVAVTVGGVLSSPWLARLALLEIWPVVTSPVAAVSPPGYNVFPWFYFQSSLEKGWLLIAVLAAIWGLLCQDRAICVTAGWAIVVVTVLNIGPGTWLVNNNSWAITLFVPGAILAGWGVDQWSAMVKTLTQQNRHLAWRALGGVFGALVAGLAVYAGLRGSITQIGIVNPITVLATADDRAALDWVTQHTSSDALFLVNGWQWSGDIWASPDGGIWLWPWTKRHTTLPPLDYYYQPEWFAQVNAFNAHASQIKDWTSPEARALLSKAGVTHVFIGERGGFLKPELFVDKPGYSLVYSNGADWIFELK